MSETRRFGWLARILGRGQVMPSKSGLMCQELVELITSYIDNTLKAEDHVRVEAHLAVCPHCARYLEQIRQTIRATGSLREEDLHPEAKEALLGAFRNWKANSANS